MSSLILPNKEFVIHFIVAKISAGIPLAYVASFVFFFQHCARLVMMISRYVIVLTALAMITSPGKSVSSQRNSVLRSV